MFFTQRDAREALTQLTQRELEIARCVAEGLSNADIARQLFLGEATVKTHLTRATSRLGVNRVQLALLVDRAG